MLCPLNFDLLLQAKCRGSSSTWAGAMPVWLDARCWKPSRRHTLTTTISGKSSTPLTCAHVADSDGRFSPGSLMRQAYLEMAILYIASGGLAVRKDGRSLDSVTCDLVSPKEGVVSQHKILFQVSSSISDLYWSMHLIFLEP